MKMNLITMFLKALELQEYTRVDKQDRSLRDGSTSRCGEVYGEGRWMTSQKDIDEGVMTMLQVRKRKMTS